MRSLYAARPGGSTVSSEINMIPFIDVMLVLLVIFMVTAPLLTHRVLVNLPQASSQAASSAGHALNVTIQADGKTFLENQPIDRKQLIERFRAAAQADPQTELHFRADASVAYGQVAELLSAASSAGIGRIGFVTQPSGLP